MTDGLAMANMAWVQRNPTTVFSPFYMQPSSSWPAKVTAPEDTLESFSWRLSSLKRMVADPPK